MINFIIQSEAKNPISLTKNVFKLSEMLHFFQNDTFQTASFFIIKNVVHLIVFLKLKIMSDSNYTKLYTGNLIIAQRIIQELEDIGINAIMREQNESGLDPKIYGGHLLQEIHVNKDELEKAVIAVENITSELQD